MFIVIKLHLDLNPPSDHMLPICPVFYFFSPFWMIFSDFFSLMHSLPWMLDNVSGNLGIIKVALTYQKLTVTFSALQEA